MVLQYGLQGITNGVGIYYCTYILGNPDALGLFSAAQFDAHGRAAEHGAVQMYFVFFVGIRGGVCDYRI